MHDVLRHLLRTLAGARFEPLPTLSLRRAQESLNRDQESATTAEVVAALTPETPCPACAQADEMEGIHLRTLVEHMVGADSLSPAFLESDGLCLPHFRQALGRVRRPAAFESLLSAQRTIWGHLEGQLAEAIRKSDTRFRHEPAGDEAGAWLRGIAAVSGPRETDDS
jgi:hypothetical protein